jgi:hypothetical protein
MNRCRSIFIAWIAGGMLCGIAFAEPTAIDVRVISKGAKFVGSSMGGVEVVVRDAETGLILARGKTAGTTGDTAKLMTEKARHHAPVSTEDAAVFRAVVDLAEPRRIKVTARGPLSQRQAENTASVTQWVVPGKPITGGDGWVLVLPGFAVNLLAPPAHVSLAGTPQSVVLRANVCMMCGCPITPGGLWDADQFEVAAFVDHDGQKHSELPLEYAGQPSQFQATLEVDTTGLYEVIVYAHDPENGNTGVDKTTFIVTE